MLLVGLLGGAIEEEAEEEEEEAETRALLLTELDFDFTDFENDAFKGRGGAGEEEG